MKSKKQRFSLGLAQYKRPKQKVKVVGGILPPYGFPVLMAVALNVGPRLVMTLFSMRATYPTIENAYQAAKCVNPDDQKLFVDITAGKAKKLGRKVKIKPGWDEIKEETIIQSRTIPEPAFTYRGKTFDRR